MGEREESTDRTVEDIRDGARFVEVYTCYRPAVTRLARCLCRNEELAQDVVQEVFVRLWQRPERFDPQRGSMRAFLLMECRSRAIDAVRGEVARQERQHRPHTLSPAATGGPDEHTVKREICDSVRQALDRLPAELRSPLVLAFYEDFPYNDVARILRIPEGTAKSRLRRAMHRLARDPVLMDS